MYMTLCAHILQCAYTYMYKYNAIVHGVNSR